MAREKVIGILGGMGPAATIELFAKIVKMTDVRTDQEHFRILIDNNPKIPNRTLAIQRKGPSPLPELKRSAKALERAGADFIVMPCVTAHFFYPALQRSTSLPILHIVDETVRHVLARCPGVDVLGVLASTGTIQTGLFQKALATSVSQVLVPTASVQQRYVMRAIASVKAIGPSTLSKGLAIDAANTLIGRGAQVIIAGCTEIPLVLQDGDLKVPVIDPLAVLANAAIAYARPRRR